MAVSRFTNGKNLSDARPHFGDFIRYRIANGSGTHDPMDMVEFCATTGIKYFTLRNWLKLADSADTAIDPDHRAVLAKGLGFDSWDTMEVVWRDSPLPPHKPRQRPKSIDPAAIPLQAFTDDQLAELLRLIGREQAVRRDGPLEKRNRAPAATKGIRAPNLDTKTKR